MSVGLKASWVQRLSRTATRKAVSISATGRPSSASRVPTTVQLSGLTVVVVAGTVNGTYTVLAMVLAGWSLGAFRALVVAANPKRAVTMPITNLVPVIMVLPRIGRGRPTSR